MGVCVRLMHTNSYNMVISKIHQGWFQEKFNRSDLHDLTRHSCSSYPYTTYIQHYHNNCTKHPQFFRNLFYLLPFWTSKHMHKMNCFAVNFYTMKTRLLKEFRNADVGSLLCSVLVFTVLRYQWTSEAPTVAVELLIDHRHPSPCLQFCYQSYSSPRTNVIHLRWGILYSNPQWFCQLFLLMHPSPKNYTWELLLCTRIPAGFLCCYTNCIVWSRKCPAE